MECWEISLLHILLAKCLIYHCVDRLIKLCNYKRSTPFLLLTANDLNLDLVYNDLVGTTLILKIWNETHLSRKNHIQYSCLVATHINRGIPEASPTVSHGSQHSQDVDLISILKGAADNNDVSPINKAVKQWTNYGDVQSRDSLDHGSMDISHQDLRDAHHLQQFVPV